MATGVVGEDPGRAAASRRASPWLDNAVQRAECDAGGVLQYILTLETADGLYVFLSAPAQQLGAQANEGVDDVCGGEVAPAMAHLPFSRQQVQVLAGSITC